MTNIKERSILIKTAISVFLLALLLFRMDTEILSHALSHFHIKYWVMAIIFCISQMILLSIRWKFLLNVGKKHLTLRKALEISLTSQLANLAFITSLGGLLARIALTAQHGVGIAKVVIATFFDRLFTILSLVVLSVVFLPGITPYVQKSLPAHMTEYALITILLGILVLTICIKFIIQKTPQKYRTKNKVRYGIRYLKVVANNMSLVVKISFISIVAQTCFFMSTFILCVGSGADINFAQLMTVLPIISLIAALPISIGGWGVREGAFMFGLGILGVSAETSFAISIQVGLIGIMSTVLVGIPSLMSLRLNIPDITKWRKKHA